MAKAKAAQRVEGRSKMSKRQLENALGLREVRLLDVRFD